MNIEEELNKIQKELKDDIFNTRAILPVSGKFIKDCLMEQINLQDEWEGIVSHISNVYYKAEHEADTIFSKKFNAVNKNAHAVLTASELKHEATADPDYSKAKGLQNKAYGFKKRAEGMLKTIETRKYILKDLSALVINGTERFELR